MDRAGRSPDPWRAGVARVVAMIVVATATARAVAAGHGDPSPSAASRGRAEIDLRALHRIEHPPLGLPPVPLPAANRPTVAKIPLGRKLFLDRRLSRTGHVSGALCHLAGQGITASEISTRGG